MSLVRQKQRDIAQRGLQVTRTYLRRGQTVSRSIWVTPRPKHPLMKVAAAPPMAVLVLVMLIMILLALGFTLLAIALLAAISRGEKGKEDRVT